MIVALLGLYPVLATALGLLTTGVLFLAGTSNLFLLGLCVLFYSAVPTGSFHPWFQSTLDFAHTAFPEAMGKFLHHVQLSFPYHEAHPPKRALYLWHPHGLMSMAPMIHSVVHHHSRLASLSVFHQMPVVRDLYSFVRSVPSDYASMKAVLETESLSVTPGGVREMMRTEPGVMRLVMADRRGVFRLALETGTPIVPVLTYGELELFPMWNPPFLKALNAWCHARFGWILPIPTLTGIRNWMQLSEAPLPPIRSYAGAPIPVEKQEATEEAVTLLRTRYLRRLRALFRKTAPAGVRLVVEPTCAEKTH